MDTINTIRQIDILAQMSYNRRRKVYKERANPFSLPDELFKLKYRLKKLTVKKILKYKRRTYIRQQRMWNVCRTLITGCVALLGSWRYDGLTHPTVSRICIRVARALASHGKEIIKMPSSLEEEAVLMRNFEAIKCFPGIIGAIDGTHIRIKKTGGDLAQYYINRKGYYSLNVQVICDSNLKIRDMVARWRGSTHDCRIFNESTIKRRFENCEFKGRLLGDSGYKLTTYLFTPLHQPQNGKDVKYNAAHIATRNPVERCFGVWKQRFRCLLHGMTVSLSSTKVVIIALAVLHNIAIEENDSVPDDFDENLLRRMEAIQTPPYPTTSQGRAKIILKTFIQNNF